MEKTISFKLKIWRQKGPKEKGQFKVYEMKDIPTDTSFLEMLDILNEQLINAGEEPVVFDMTAARVSAVCAHSTSTVIRTAPLQVLPPVSSTCAVSRMVRPSP